MASSVDTQPFRHPGGHEWRPNHKILQLPDVCTARRRVKNRIGCTTSKNKEYSFRGMANAPYSAEDRALEASMKVSIDICICMVDIALRSRAGELREQTSFVVAKHLIPFSESRLLSCTRVHTLYMYTSYTYRTSVTCRASMLASGQLDSSAGGQTFSKPHGSC